MAIALATAIQELIQQDVLRRRYESALRPAQLFRGIATRREKWPARLGQEEIFTRTGLLAINARPRTPGQDPTPQKKASIEQWKVTARPYNDTTDTHLPSDYVMIQSDFMRDAVALAVQAGQTINHVVRNRVYAAYSGGNTYMAETKASSTTHRVPYLQGLDTVLSAKGHPVPVSGAAKLAVTVAGVANNIIGVIPDNVDLPEGPGQVVFETAVAVTKGDPLLAVNRSRVIRVGGAATSNGLTPSDKLKLAHIRAGVTQLRNRHVPTFADGTYHFHCNADSEAQLFEDPEFQALISGTGLESSEIRDFAIGRALGVTFIRNMETPGAHNTSDLDYVPFDTQVAMGNYTEMPIHRPILLGDTSIIEKYLPQDAFVSEVGVQGSIGGFNITSDGGVATQVDGIRYLVRPPQNRLQDVVSQTWGWDGDWGIPTDSLSVGDDLYKRAVVFEHA